jgi:hypothetical protein
MNGHLAMWNRQHQTQAALSHQERRQREDEAPRLTREVRQLAALDIEIVEYRAGGGGAAMAARYTRRVVIQHAPAHFEIPCSDERCAGGGYELTHEIMRALRARRTVFDGQGACSGSVGSGDCGRFLRYFAHASYIDDATTLGHARAKDRRASPPSRGSREPYPCTKTRQHGLRQRSS